MNVTVNRMPASRRIPLVLAIAFLLLTAGCSREPGVSARAVESVYQDVRSWKDTIEVTRARGASRTPQGVPLADLVATYNAARAKLRDALPAVRLDGLPMEDRRALDAIRRNFAQDLGEERDLSSGEEETGGRIDCAYNASMLSASPSGTKDLSDRMYACFGRAAYNLP